MRDGERSDREGVGVREALVSLPHPHSLPSLSLSHPVPSTSSVDGRDDERGNERERNGPDGRKGWRKREWTEEREIE